MTTSVPPFLVGLDPPQIAGYIGAALISSFQLPQIYKSWKTRSTADVSIYMLWALIIAGMCMIYYGISISSKQIIVGNVLCTTQAFVLLYLVHLYRHVRK